MVVLGTIIEHPLQEQVHCIVGLIIADANYLNGHLRDLSVLQDGEHIVERTVVAEATVLVLLKVETDE